MKLEIPKALTTTQVEWSNRGVKVLLPKFLKGWVEPWPAYAAEFLGTFVFVFISSGSVLTDAYYKNVGNLGIVLATGLSISAMVFATVGISGGHINPAVTLAMWLSQKINGVRAFFYILCQILGSFAAAGLLFWIFGRGSLDLALGAPGLGIGVSVQTAVIIEAVLTAILVLVVFATMIDKRGQGSLGPLAIGLVVVAAGIFAGPLTGAAINPARVIGPAMIAQVYDDLFVWIVGPLAGALFGLVYDFLFLRKPLKG